MIWTKKAGSHIYYALNASVNSKPDNFPPPNPWRPLAIYNILVALGVGFSLLCPARASVFPRLEVLNQSKSSIISKKAWFLLCLLNKWIAAPFICLYMLEVNSVT